MGSRNDIDPYKYERMRLLYLLFGSRDVLPPSYAKLQSYLNIHMANLIDEQNLPLLRSITDRNRTCPYCYSVWSGDTMSFKLLPSKKYRPPKACSGTTEKGKGESNESRNTLVLKCKVCTKKSSFALVKLKPIEVEFMEDNVVPVKKKKKKKDKSCGLAVNLIKHKENSDETAILKKEKRMKKKEKKAANLALAQSFQSTESPKDTPVPKAMVNVKSKTAPNPFAIQIQKGLSKKKAKKLEKLKQAVKGEKNLVKKTLQDFLTLV